MFVIVQLSGSEAEAWRREVTRSSEAAFLRRLSHTFHLGR